MRFQLRHVTNGTVLRIEPDAGDGTEVEEIVYQERDGDEIEAFADFLWTVTEHYGPTTSRSSPKRIRISVEPGDKYADAIPGPEGRNPMGRS